MSVVNGSITQRDAWCPDDFVETYFSVLTPPVVLGEPDALIAGLTTTPLFSWCDLNAPEPATAVNGGDWICPNCGIMSATHGVWSSPPETWAKLCGRSYRYTLCVTCQLALSASICQQGYPLRTHSKTNPIKYHKAHDQDPPFSAIHHRI
jgi:hypothetical protein